MAENRETRVNSFAALAALTADGTAEWPLDGRSFPRGEDWRRADRPPEPGERRWTRIAFDPAARPNAGDQPWLLFVPEEAQWNGWDACPETLPRSAFVHCRIVDVAGPTPTQVWIEADILKVVVFSDLAACFAPVQVDGLETWGGRHDGVARWDDWELLWAPRDDAGFWLLAVVAQDGVHVLAGGEWILRQETAWAGHVLLSPMAWARICDPAGA